MGNIQSDKKTTLQKILEAKLYRIFYLKKYLSVWLYFKCWHLKAFYEKQTFTETQTDQVNSGRISGRMLPNPADRVV